MKGLVDFMKKANDDGWLKPSVNGVATVIVGISGYLLSLGPNIQAIAIILLILVMILMFVVELAYAKTIKMLKKEALKEAKEEMKENKRAQDEILKKAQFDLELESETIGFLVRNTNFLNKIICESITNHKIPNLLHGIEAFNGPATISTALYGLCHALVNASTILGYGTRASIMFRSTYMKVTKNESGDEILAYYAYYTPDNLVPRSMIEGKTFQKRSGCAGICWDRQRPVIEDAFVDNKEWINNYPGHGKLYQSMVCFPVIRYLNKEQKAIGVITVDSNISKFFGIKDDRNDEQIVARWIRPFADYVLLIESYIELLQEIKKSGIKIPTL